MRARVLPSTFADDKYSPRDDSFTGLPHQFEADLSFKIFSASLILPEHSTFKVQLVY